MTPEPVTPPPLSDASSVTGQRICDGCGEPFPPRRRDARHCSGACRQRAHRARHEPPRAPRRRRPIPDAWRDATYDLRKAAERVQRLIRDDRFTGNLPALHAIGARDIATASEVIAEFRSVTESFASNGFPGGAA